MSDHWAGPGTCHDPSGMLSLACMQSHSRLTQIVPPAPGISLSLSTQVAGDLIDTACIHAVKFWVNKVCFTPPTLSFPEGITRLHHSKVAMTPLLHHLSFASFRAYNVSNLLGNRIDKLRARSYWQEQSLCNIFSEVSGCSCEAPLLYLLLLYP